MKKIQLIILLISLVIATSAQNNDGDVQIKRNGFIIGVAPGGGMIFIKDKDADTEIFGRVSILNLKLGYMINPKTAICLHVPSGGRKDNGETRAFEGILITGQYWYSTRFWGSAGVGLGMDMPSLFDVKNDDPKMYFGTALCAGVGYEIWQKGRFALDIQGRCLYGLYEAESIKKQCSVFDILIGFNWY